MWRISLESELINEIKYKISLIMIGTNNIYEIRRLVYNLKLYGILLSYICILCDKIITPA